MNHEITELAYAQHLDQTDPLNQYRNSFYFPKKEGKELIYFCGNSLGLQPKGVAAAIQQELTDWQNLAVGGYFNAKHPWLRYQNYGRETLAKLVGAETEEVTIMNTLTVNLHLLLTSFYKPTAERNLIIMEAGAFPSDQYAAETQVKWHGFDPEKTIIELVPREGEKTLRTEDILSVIMEHQSSVALVLLGGINYYTGQWFNMQAITNAGKKAGAVVGWDLAHCVGNVPMQLHDWDVDFAVWCSYKYLNGGPGAVGGAFIHNRYSKNIHFPRLGGWWGNDEDIRFKMEKGFIPKAEAGGWNQSTAQVFNMVGLKTSLALFEKVGIEALRKKSLLLTGYLEQLLQSLPQLGCDIITPPDPQQRGAQLCLFFAKNGRAIHEKMQAHGIICDYRESGVIRVAPAPFYCSFEDVFRFYQILSTQF